MCIWVLSWESWYSIFVLLLLVINSFCKGACSLQNFRKSLLLTCSLAFVYNAIVFSIGGMINEVVSIHLSDAGMEEITKAIFN